MPNRKTRCKICNELTQGRGQYDFTYLNERVNLCGKHAQQVMNFIKRLRKCEE